MSRPIGACRLVTLAHSLNSGSQDLASNSMMFFLRRRRTCVTPTSRSSKALARASTGRHGRRARRGGRAAVERAVFPGGSFNSRHQVALSLPSVVGRQGAVETFLPDMSNDETRALGRSAETLGGAVRKYLHRS